MAVDNLEARLELLDSLIDASHVRCAERLQEAAFSYEEVDRLPVIIPATVDGWPTFPYSEAFHDPEKMLVNELASVYAGTKLRDDRVYSVRANYGVGTMASMFGCKTVLTMDNMPWCEPLSERELLEALDCGVPDMDAGFAKKVLDTEQFYLQRFSGYPNLREAIHVYVCDTQGPFDTAHLVMGHRIYTEIYDNPRLVHRLLDLVTETYIQFTRAQKAIIVEGNDWSYHSTARVRGGVRICEDSATNLSPSSYLEFCRPYNERILSEFGGWIHYCGSGHQIFPHVISTPGLSGINFGNPDLQDFTLVYDEASVRRIGIIGWAGPFSEDDRLRIKTGVSLVMSNS